MALLLALIAPHAALAGQATPTWHLQLLHRIDPGDEAPAALGKVAQLALLPDGSVYVAESSPARVSLYNAAGKFVRDVMRQGSGPGEVHDAAIALLGDTLVVYDQKLARLSQIARTGKLLNERPLGVTYVNSPLYVTRRGDVIVTANLDLPPSTGNFVRISAHGSIDTMLWVHPVSEDRWMIWQGLHWRVQGTPYSPSGVTAVDPSGRMVIGGTKASKWFVVSGPDTVQTVVLPDHEVIIPAPIRDSAYRDWRSHVARGVPDADNSLPERKFPRTLPPWITFNIDRNGAWWIGRPDVRGHLAAWDVVVNGRLAGHLAVPADAVTGSSGPVIAFSSDRLALLHQTEDGVPWIGVYEVIRH